jgi:hypothetical protein
MLFAGAHAHTRTQVLLPLFAGVEEPSSRAIYEGDEVITINVFDEFINERPLESRLLKGNA